MKKLNIKLIDNLFQSDKNARVLICIKNTYCNLKEFREVATFLGNYYAYEEDVEDIENNYNYRFLCLERGRYSKHIGTVSNEDFFEAIKKANLKSPKAVYDANYKVYSCDSIKDLLIKDEELE